MFFTDPTLAGMGLDSRPRVTSGLKRRAFEVLVGLQMFFISANVFSGVRALAAGAGLGTPNWESNSRALIPQTRNLFVSHKSSSTTLFNDKVMHSRK